MISPQDSQSDSVVETTRSGEPSVVHGHKKQFLDFPYVQLVLLVNKYMAFELMTLSLSPLV